MGEIYNRRGIKKGSVWVEKFESMVELCGCSFEQVMSLG